MRALGASLIAACDRGGVITLRGDLGTGKTTLVRGALEAAGVEGAIRSPTYTLIELYPLAEFSVAHFDLYRLGDPEELEFLGFRDYLNAATLCFIEWPERAADMLQTADVEIAIDYDAAGRDVRITGFTEWGRSVAAAVK